MARSTPPLLPEEALGRTVRTARLDGLMVLGITGTLAVLSALGKDRYWAAFYLIYAGAGAAELHGAGLLQAGYAHGVRWLVGAQGMLFVLTAGLAAYFLAHPNIEIVRKTLADSGFMDSPDFTNALKELGLTVDQYLLLSNRIGCSAAVVISSLYQGGMIVYYLRRRRPIAAALE